MGVRVGSGSRSRGNQAISKPTAGMLFGTWGPGRHLKSTQHTEPGAAQGSLPDALGLRDPGGSETRERLRVPKTETQQNMKQTRTHGRNSSSGIQWRVQPLSGQGVAEQKKQGPGDQHRQTKKPI